jgi:hypothetical protein
VVGDDDPPTTTTTTKGHAVKQCRVVARSMFPFHLCVLYFSLGTDPRLCSLFAVPSRNRFLWQFPQIKRVNFENNASALSAQNLDLKSMSHHQCWGFQVTLPNITARQ